MKRGKGRRQEEIAPDVMFLGLYLSTIVFSLATFVDLIFIVPTLISFLIWLSLTLMVLSKKGVNVKASLLDRRLVSGLPSNKKLHTFYIATLLVSLMLFFIVMLRAKELHLLFAFVMWLFIGSLFMQELGEGTESKENRKTATR